MKKPSIGKHFAQPPVNNPFSRFSQAYNFVASNPTKKYRTVTSNRKNGVIFKAEARLANSGKHKGKKVIQCETKKSIVYIYECCWNCKSNCSGTHINTYSKAIK